jgi:NhaA family Na+:H+ antiporter
VHVRAITVYVALGSVLWYVTYRAGVNPTIAGVALGLLTPAEPFQRPGAVSQEAHRTAEETVDDPEPPDADARWWLRLAALSREAVSPLARLEHGLLPWSSFVILPLFALANAGVELSSAALGAAVTGAVGMGVFLGLVLGKPVGIWGMSRLAAAGRIGRIPGDVGWNQVLGMGAIAGIGFTMSLFIAGLAFGGRPELLNEAKVAILAASVTAGIAGTLILRLVGPTPIRRTRAVSGSI